MSEYDNNNSGALFKNEDKREGKRDPDYKGSAEVAGVEYWLSAWINTSKAGQKYMSLKFKPKEERVSETAPAPVQKAATFDDFDDAIPF